jgi:hypothetical protein
MSKSFCGKHLSLKKAGIAVALWDLSSMFYEFILEWKHISGNKLMQLSEPKVFVSNSSPPLVARRF